MDFCLTLSLFFLPLFLTFSFCAPPPVFVLSITNSMIFYPKFIHYMRVSCFHFTVMKFNGIHVANPYFLWCLCVLCVGSTDNGKKSTPKKKKPAAKTLHRREKKKASRKIESTLTFKLKLVFVHQFIIRIAFAAAPYRLRF